MPDPGTLRMKCGVVVGRLGLIIDGVRPLQQYLAQLLLSTNIAKAVAPQARLRSKGFESQALCPRVSHAALFAVDERREPLVLSGIHAPAIEIEVVAGQGRAAVGAVEAHDVEILFLHPNAPDEAAFARLGQWIDVKDQATHLAHKP